MGYVPPKGDDAVEDHYKRTMTKLGVQTHPLAPRRFCGLWSIVVDDRSLRPAFPPALFCGLWSIIAEESFFRAQWTRWPRSRLA